MDHMKSLGYDLIESDEMLLDEESLSIPQLYDFVIQPNTSIDSVASNIPISDEFRQMITDANFGIKLVKTGVMKGGFYAMEKPFTLAEASGLIRRLARQTNRKLRIGTPLEAFKFWFENSDKFPHYFLVCGKIYKNNVIRWRYGISAFVLVGFAGEWSPDNKIFIVEDFA